MLDGVPADKQPNSFLLQTVEIMRRFLEAFLVGAAPYSWTSHDKGCDLLREIALSTSSATRR
jgi:hypothetical protein